MDAALNNALSQPDVEETLISALDHADLNMRRYIWRGFKPGARKEDRELMVNGKTASDFVNEALKRLCEGKRSYDPSRTLLENLNSITDSVISSEKKSSDRNRLVDHREQTGESEEWGGPLATMASNDIAPDQHLAQSELADWQAKCFASIMSAFDGNEHMQRYLEALSEGFYDIEEISALTEIPVAKIYELRRKLKKVVPSLFGAMSYADFKHISNIE